MKHSRILILVCLLVWSTFIHAEEQWTTEIVLNGENVPIKDGVDLSGRNLRGIVINRHEGANPAFSSSVSIGYGTLRNMKFDGSDLTGADLGETVFESCSFAKTIWRDTMMYKIDPSCNMNDAFFIGQKQLQLITIPKELLITTRNYKIRKFSRFQFYKIDFKQVDFSHCNFSTGNFDNCILKNTDFRDAIIENVKFTFGTRIFKEYIDAQGVPSKGWFDRTNSDSDLLSIEQLLTTQTFKDGVVNSVNCDRLHWPPEKVIDLSKKIFMDCNFGYSDKTARIDLTDSVISGCNFECFQGLTVENVKSTWNYKIGSMEGIKLPKKIQEALDVAKKER